MKRFALVASVFVFAACSPKTEEAAPAADAAMAAPAMDSAAMSAMTDSTMMDSTAAKTDTVAK